MKDFYTAFATVSFTVLGLWMFVVQTRRTEWVHSTVHLRRAYAIHLQFGLAGLMSMLSLVDSSSRALWRGSFGVSAAAGALVLVFLRNPGQKGTDAIAEAGHLFAAALFVVISVVAIFPSLPHRMGINLSALGVEAVMLSIMIFVGVNMAWLLMFDEVEADDLSA